MNIYYEAAIWLSLALLASVVSIRVAVPVALVAIVVGAFADALPADGRGRRPGGSVRRRGRVGDPPPASRSVVILVAPARRCHAQPSSSSLSSLMPK
jgi:hypothetical protein